MWTAKFGFFLVLVLGCTFRLFPIYIEILEFLNVPLDGLLSIGFFENKPKLYFQIFPNSLKDLRNWNF